MEHHPLLKELLALCTTHNVEPAKAYTTYEVFMELCEVRKLADLNYFFDENLKLFYLTGKKETKDESPSIFVPVMCNDEMTPQELNSVQEVLSPHNKQIYLFIRDRDSTSTCYCITKGLVKPDSPETCKLKKELEQKKYQFNKSIEKNKKLLYSRALRQKKEAEKVAAQEPKASCEKNVEA